MITKTLSIIIPTYNMEKYLPQCLDSITNIVNIRALEIIIVNDGSTDSSSLIAHKYAEKYPNSIIVVDKQNANYGSCINKGLSIATGKYVKVLDSDDWFNSNSFERFICELEKIDADLILTDFTLIYSNRREEIRSPQMLSGHVYDTSILEDINIQMHQITYRLSVLKSINYVQQEGIFYTDYEWCFWPMIAVKKVYYIKNNLYQYRCGRSGQTMDPQVIIRRYRDIMLGLYRMIEIFNKNKDDIDRDIMLKKYLLKTLCNRSIDLYLLFLTRKKKFSEDLMELDNYIKTENIELYNSLNVNRGYISNWIQNWRISRKYPSRMSILFWTNIQKLYHYIHSMRLYRILK